MKWDESNGMTEWETQDSIYYHKPGPFMDLVINIDNRSASISDALQNFREVKCLPRLFREMKIGELRQNPELVAELYNSLKKGMAPLSKISLPYGSIAERGQQLIDNIASFGNVDISKAKHKIIKGHYDGDGLNYHYLFEIAAAPYTDSNLKYGSFVTFIGAINNAPSVDDGHGYFEGANYSWIDKKRGYERQASSITEILYKCGFDDSLPVAKQKQPCIFIANLVCPVIEWQGGYGKSRISNLHVFANEIAKATVTIANQMPTFHGSGGFSRDDKLFGHAKTEKNSIEDYLIELLSERRNAVQQDSSLKIKARWTQSTVWYRLRPILLHNGVEPSKTWSETRLYVQGMINKVCKQEFGVPREALGIIASARAVMYHAGKSQRVNLDMVKELAKNGTDIIFVEKEGIVDVLTSYADEYGIALVNTQGRLTEYGKDLIEAAKVSGANVAILTDYDALGIQIAEGSRIQIPRIGIDRDTIRYFQQHGYQELSEDDVEEEYEPNKNAIDPVALLAISDSQRYRYIDAEYLRSKRIELDSMMAIVGAKGLWEYISHQLKIKFPEGRNYNRVISMPQPDKLFPREVQDFIYYVRSFVSKLLSSEEERIRASLRNVKDLLILNDKNKEIEEKLRTIVANDEGMKQIVSELDKMMESGELPDSEY